VVDPKQYKEHNYGNWSFLMGKIKSLPLKFVMENEQFKMTSVAIEAKGQELSLEFFKLPDGVPTKPSPF
jgi:hypothetical protein